MGYESAGVQTPGYHRPPLWGYAASPSERAVASSRGMNSPAHYFLKIVLMRSFQPRSVMPGSCGSRARTC
jgi:hypothetical protein